MINKKKMLEAIKKIKSVSLLSKTPILNRTCKIYFDAGGLYLQTTNLKSSIKIKIGDTSNNITNPIIVTIAMLEAVINLEKKDNIVILDIKKSICSFLNKEYPDFKFKGINSGVLPSNFVPALKNIYPIAKRGILNISSASYIEWRDKCLVATDNHVCARAKLAINEHGKILVPWKSAREISKIFKDSGDIIYHISDNVIYMQQDNIKYYTTLVEHTGYPATNDLFSEFDKVENAVYVDKAKTVKNLVIACNGKRDCPAVIDFIKGTAHTTDGKDIPLCIVSQEFEYNRIMRINLCFLLDALKAQKNSKITRINFFAEQKYSPLLISSIKDTEYLIAPMKML